MYGGMTKREYSANKAWNALSPEEQQKRRESAKKSLLSLHTDNPNKKRYTDTGVENEGGKA